MAFRGIPLYFIPKMGSSNTQRLGKDAEQRASDYYSANGYEIVGMNYRHRRGEIDLIASKDDLLVFIEVKYRRGSAYGHPEEFVSQRQRQLIVETADHYIHENDWHGNIRFDIVALDRQMKVELFEDAFY